MLLILPLAAFLLLWGGLSVRHVGSGALGEGGVRAAFLASAALWGAFLTLTSEILSLFHFLTLPGLAAAWLVGALAAGTFAWRVDTFQQLGLAIRRASRADWDGRSVWAFGVALLLCGLLFLVAWISPPNTTDSLLYHLSRVAHWQQNASLAHYPTAYNNQLWTQIWAELGILNLTVLWGSDQTANMVQWFSMVGSLVAASAMAKLLGAGRRGQWLSVAFVFSLPIGILESTSTQNDYVAAFWLACFTYFVLLSRKRDLTGLEWLSMSLALGLGMLTKATVYLYAFPVVVWLLGADLLRGRVKRSILSGLGIGLTIGVLNLGYWLRDIITFGGPFGSSDWTASRVPLNGWAAHLMGPLQHILLNFATPSESITHSIVAGERGIEAWLNVPQVGFNLTWAWNNEDFAGNPVHVVLIGLSLLGLCWLWRRRSGSPAKGPVGAYAIVWILSFLLFSAFALYAEHGIRYQIPAFIIFSPIVGVVWERLLPERWVWSASLGLAVISLPWILFNQTRPIVSWRPRTRVNSIFVESRQRLLFANWPEYREPYTRAADLVQQSGCRDVGLAIDSHDKEYLLWSVLGAPENGMRLEVVDPLSASSKYSDPTFEPCAVVCTICGSDRTEWRGLPLAGDFGAARVFLSP